MRRPFVSVSSFSRNALPLWYSTNLRALVEVLYKRLIAKKCYFWGMWCTIVAMISILVLMRLHPTIHAILLPSFGSLSNDLHTGELPPFLIGGSIITSFPSFLFSLRFRNSFKNLNLQLSPTIVGSFRGSETAIRVAENNHRRINREQNKKHEI